MIDFVRILITHPETATEEIEETEETKEKTSNPKVVYTKIDINTWIPSLCITFTMADFEEWENDDFIPVLQVQPTEEQLKRIQEQKCIEESENELISDLFSNETPGTTTHTQPTPTTNTKPNKDQPNKDQPNKTKPSKPKPTKQQEIIQLQKEVSKRNQELKRKKQREKDIFGEITEDNEYQEYEDKFYD